MHAKFNYPLFIVACACLCGQAFAAVPVVDLSSSPERQTAPARPMTAAPQQQMNAAADLHYQLQILQDEIRTLRGMVEEQANEIRQLKQRQMDDYMDLDRRLSGGAGGAPGGGPRQSDNSASVATGLKVDNTPPPNQQEQLEDYTAAYNLLKERKIDAAITAFKQHIERYPSGPYVANAHYWLGEIYLLQNELPQAEKAFAAVVDNFPAHRKAGDAAFKLGKVYHLQGKKDKAREVLQKVASGNSSAAALAKAYLRDSL